MSELDVPDFINWYEPEAEKALLDSITLDAPWEIVEKFSTLVRLSGSDDEGQAFDLLMARLEEWSVSYELHQPVCFISWPIAATLRESGDGGRKFRAKTTAMAISTDGAELTGELVFAPPMQPDGVTDDWSTGIDLRGIDARGKILVVEGMPAPGRVQDAMKAGALAGIFINPGEYIHESIVTTIWGSPDLASADRQPTIPVLGVNRSDGEALLELARNGASVTFSTTVETGWRPIPVLVAEIRGSRFPDEFVLLHGHVDSWHVGVGDNAVGNATMLELARVFQQHSDKLQRSIRIAWWSGHSHGRYAGSTWYADQFAIDLANNCVAQVNCDSPGCRYADTFIELTCMSEADPLVGGVVDQLTGLPFEPERPPRAGDYSFNGIGITSYLMLSSTMSREKRNELGLYGVGGCGANIQWHTEQDTLEIADRDNLLRDMKVYAAAVSRPVNASLHPFDWRRTVAEMLVTTDRYQAAAATVDLSPVTEALNRLDAALRMLYGSATAIRGNQEREVGFNQVQRGLARLLVPIKHTQALPFQHDPAMEIMPLPDLAVALQFSRFADDVGQRRMAETTLIRGRNRVVWTIHQAARLVEDEIARPV